MTVYVDDAFIPYGRMLMCHMIADTEEELHRMAAKIGIKRKWYQAQASIPHYDISKSKRALAIAFGAREVTSQELVKIARGKDAMPRPIRPDNLIKPKKKAIALYDFTSCTEYIEKKYGIDTRDYAGRFNNNDPSAPYQDFWHFILGKAEVVDGCIVTMASWWFDDAEDWQREIGGYYLDEFGEVTDEDGGISATFYMTRDN